MAANLWLRYIAVAAWMALIFVFSHQPSEVSSGQSGWVVAGIEGAIGLHMPETLVRKTAHALVYAVLGVLSLRLLRAHGVSWRQAGWGAVGIAFVYACTDELHQMFVPGRSAEVGDVFLDTVAAAIAVLIGVRLGKRALHKVKK